MNERADTPTCSTSEPALRPRPENALDGVFRLGIDWKDNTWLHTDTEYVSLGRVGVTAITPGTGAKTYYAKQTYDEYGRAYQHLMRPARPGPGTTTSRKCSTTARGRIIATAIMDRVLHHAITIDIRGNSYRPRTNSKPG